VLSNTVRSTAENGGSVKVADLAVADDGLGTNELSLAGAMHLSLKFARIRSAAAGSFGLREGRTTRPKRRMP
jgi:hypothetical protein